MTDLTGLDELSGTELTETRIQGILAQIDLDIVNLLRDGKLSALKYRVPGAGGQATDRAANLKALLEARAAYRKLLESLPSWETAQYDDGGPANDS